MLRILSIIILTSTSSIFYAQNVLLDQTFGNLGLVTTSTSGSEEIMAIALQPDGKILAAGRSIIGSNDFILARYNSDGTLDNTFSSDGLVTTDLDSISMDYCSSIAIQNDGKIVLAGYSLKWATFDHALVRYNSNGSIDSSFGINGIVINDLTGGGDWISCITLMSDGKFLTGGNSTVGSYFDFTLARYNSNGSLDTSFNTVGFITTDIGGYSDMVTSMAIQIDGKILLAGRSEDTINHPNIALLRYNSDGSIDNTFDTDGKVITPIGSSSSIATSVKLQPGDGKILVGGWTGNGSNYDFVVARYNVNGILDTSFNSDGIAITVIGPKEDLLNGIVLQSDGKIIAAGCSRNNQFHFNFALVRYNTNGLIDTTLNGTGIVITDFDTLNSDWGSCVLLQPDDKIVVAGYSAYSSTQDLALARYMPNLEIGIEPIDLLDNLIFYPNPTTDQSILEFSLIFGEILNIELFDMNGKSVATLADRKLFIPGLNQVLIPQISILKPGAYNLVLSNKSGHSSIKFIK